MEITHDYVKRLIPEIISPEGGAYVQLVNKKTVALSTSIKEANDGLYTLGDPQLVQSTIEGLFQSMAAGVQRDGYPRQLGDFITLYPQPTGPIDIDKGWVDGENEMVLKARLLNKMVLNTRGWTFRDVTPGKDDFKIENISTGAGSNLMTLGKAVHVNGGDFPAVDKLTIEWAVEGMSAHGVVALEHLSGDATRIDIAADAFDEVKSAAYDGKTLTLTVRGNFSKYTKSATLKFVPPPAPVVTGVQQGTLDPNVVWFSGGKLTIAGENLAGTTQVRFEMDDEGETIVNDITDSIEEITDTALSTDEYGFENDSERQDLDWSGKNAKLIVVKGEESVEYAVTFKVAE